MTLPSRKRIIEWVLDTWSQLSKENIIKLLKCCNLNLAINGTEDKFTHNLKMGQSCKAGQQNVNSQLSILVDESDAVNPLIYPLDEGDANEEMNVIEDETEIIMKICNFSIACTVLKKKAISTIPQIYKQINSSLLELTLP